MKAPAYRGTSMSTVGRVPAPCIAGKVRKEPSEPTRRSLRRSWVSHSQHHSARPSRRASIADEPGIAAPSVAVAAHVVEHGLPFGQALFGHGRVVCCVLFLFVVTLVSAQPETS
jgi:hypothetical protein